MLFGRHAEREAIGELLDGARRMQSGALVLRGEPGVGKSALLEDARSRAGDMLVLEGLGIESESQLPFAALDQLLRPVLAHLPRLPAPQREALSRALGLEAGPGEDRFLVAVAVLTLLSEAAEERPVLCLVDDAHWLDGPSADALVFAGRRLGAEGVVMLFAARDGERRRFDAPGLPSLRLEGLDPKAAGELLEQGAGVSLPADLRTRLVEGTAGNPLALLELPAALTGEQLSGVAPLVEPLPVSARVEQAFLERARRLPADTQTLLLVAAADDSGRLDLVLAGGRRLGAGVEALDAAEESGLVRVAAGRISFRHPLVRSAVYQAAPFSRRRAAHQALADALEGEAEADRRAWHRAAACIEPDPGVVAELVAAADRARARGGYSAASVALERAAALTDDDGARAQLLATGASDAWLGGKPARTLELLQRARPIARTPTLAADIDRWRGVYELNCGVPAEACELLSTSAAAVARHDRMRALYMLAIGAFAAAYAGDDKVQTTLASAAEAVGGEHDGTALGRFLAAVVRGLTRHYAGDYAEAARDLHAAVAHADEIDQESHRRFPGLALLESGAALFAGDDEANQRFQRRTAARAVQAPGILAQAFPHSAHVQVWAGRWWSASAAAREGLEMARAIGQTVREAHLLAVLAIVAGLRGEEEECRALAEESRALATTRRAGLVLDLSRWALLVLELGSGRVEEAHACAAAIRSPGTSLWSTPDRVEAAVRTDRRDAAEEWLAPFEAWAEATGSPWARAASLHCRALVAEGDEAERLFHAALEAHERAGRPFSRARTELALGEFLRRARRRTEARGHLRAALAGFEALGASAWLERARAELRATGQTARRRDPSTLHKLTPQERQIANLVAQGLTNREVAAQLYLSPRTIDFHLRKVYAKLGVASRTGLARLDLSA